MPKVNVTVDNPNPAILYSGDWREGEPVLDSEGKRYSDNGTFKVTTSGDGIASFTFNGTAVWVFGAKRMNHGKYSVRLDGRVADTFEGQADNFWGVIYSASSLSPGLHTVALKNEPLADRPYFDIDYITYETDIGTPTESLDVAIVQDTAEQFLYIPAQQWTTTSADLQSFNGSTGHLTAQNGASVSCNFTGDAISIFGSIGKKSGPYSVTLDGGKETVYNASYTSNVADYVAQVQLYEANNLGPGIHTIVLFNRPDVVGQVLAIDHAVITNTATTKQAATKVQNENTGNESGISSGAIAGIVVGAVAVIAGFIFIIFLLRRRRKTKANGDNEKPVPFSTDTNSPWTSAAPSSAHNLLASHESSSIYPPVPMSNTSSSAVLPVQSPWSQHAPSSNSSVTSPTQDTHSSKLLYSNKPPLPSMEPASSTLSPTTTLGTSTLPSSNNVYPNEKTTITMTAPMGRTLPQPPNSLSTAANLEGRIREYGREVDAGPLPPSYVQATQPF